MDDAWDIRLSRDAGPDFAWEMALADAPPALAPYVMRFCAYREWSPAPLKRLQPPYSGLPLIIGLGEPLSVVGERYHLDGVDSFVAGLDLAAGTTEGCGHQGGVQVDLTPLGAACILGMPLESLSRNLVRLEDVLGADGLALRQRLGEVNDWASQLRLVRDFCLRRIADNPSPPPLVAYVLGRLGASRGSAPIERLAEYAGVSRKHLTQQFRVWIGLPPSAYARLLRFERALDELKRRPKSADWAQIAAGCGYYDQPHFNRDFKVFTGLSPTAYVGRLLSNGSAAA
jgi:AraC-like DNA-binding protein